MKTTKLLIFCLSIFFISCEKDEICDTSFKSYDLFAQDTLNFVKITDINTDSVLYSDSNIVGPFKLIDDGYFNVVGPNKQITLNLQYRFINDSVYGRFIGLCVFTDDCHVQYKFPLDTIKWD